MDFARPVEALIPGVQGRVLGVLARTEAEMTIRTVAGLAAVSPAEGIEVRVAWSRTRPLVTSAPSRIFLGSDSIPLIQEAARRFKDS